MTAYNNQEGEFEAAPKFLKHFYNQHLEKGMAAELQCSIYGQPKPQVKWLYNNVEIIPNDSLSTCIQQDDGFCALYIKSITERNIGTYTCILENLHGEAACTARVDVIKSEPVVPMFLKQISDQKVSTGGNVAFKVVVIGEPPPKVTWLFNHKPIHVSCLYV